MNTNDGMNYSQKPNGKVEKTNLGKMDAVRIGVSGIKSAYSYVNDSKLCCLIIRVVQMKGSQVKENMLDKRE